MIEDIVFGLGFVAVVEGLVLALAPRHFERMLAVVSQMPPERLRMLAIAIIAFGVALLALVRR